MKWDWVQSNCYHKYTVSLRMTTVRFLSPSRRQREPLSIGHQFPLALRHRPEGQRGYSVILRVGKRFVSFHFFSPLFSSQVIVLLRRPKSNWI